MSDGDLDFENRHSHLVNIGFNQQIARLMIDRFISQKEVLAQTSLSRMTIYRMRQKGEFPSPVYLNKNRTRVAWRESEVQQWMASRHSALH